jgi:hypothetical protein
MTVIAIVYLCGTRRTCQAVMILDLVAVHTTEIT